MKPQEEIYSPEFVRGLFDEMSKTYGMVNNAQPKINQGDVVFDLMSGMGECWADVAAKVGRAGRISAVDFSPQMCQKARKTAERLSWSNIELREEDVLFNSIPDDAADVVVSSFGLKTFTSEQRARLAQEVARILRPGGQLSFLEISVPSATLVRWPYMIYLRYIIPLIGWLFLGNPENYRLLGLYTGAFNDCSEFARQCTDAGLRVRLQRFFFGCATGVIGEKPSIT